MASQLEIINAALSRIGANEIVSLDEGTAEARIASASWDIARKACLRDHPWNFAIKEAELNRLSSVTPQQFKYAYRIPALCVRLLQVVGNPVYRLQSGNIQMDGERCQVRYVEDVLDTTQWDALFVDVMAQRLAADIAYGITKSQATADSMFAIYDRKIRRARHIDGTEDTAQMLADQDSIYLGARY